MLFLKKLHSSNLQTVLDFTSTCVLLNKLFGTRNGIGFFPVGRLESPIDLYCAFAPPCFDKYGVSPFSPLAGCCYKNVSHED